MTGSNDARVVVIALDAMELTVFEHLLEVGSLPNLARFAREAGRATVRSDGDTLHGSLWPTFATGANPGFHGMYFWTQWMEEEMGYARNSHPALTITPFWDALAESGVPLTIIDPPYVPLVRRPGVLQVNAWGTHDEIEPASWPAGYGTSFRKRFGKHPLEFDTVEPHGLKEKLAMVAGLGRGVDMRAQAIGTILRERRGSGFFLCAFGETHKAGHYLAAPQQLSGTATNVSAIGDILRPLDDAWPQIIDAAGPDAHIVLLALHGMVEQVDYSGGLGNQLLALALGKKPEAAVAAPDALRRLRDLMPDSVHRAIWRRLPGPLRAARQGALSSIGGDLAHDPVFRIAHDGHLGLRMNLEGRERDGRFGPGEAEAALARLAGLAAECKAPDGQPAFESLLRIGERFAGPRAHRLPDALLLATPTVHRATTILGPGGRELANHDPEARNGIHTGRGFVFMRGASGSTASLARTEVDNRDFAPSLLSLYGVPSQRHHEGTVFFG
ncbi:MAG: alkaline phosphatase family protein [Dehalococcoidia bacterium]|nr:alkaline phosphatase family protein [Dehalococcoidia bacterium]